MASLAGKRAIVFVDDEYEDLELWYPKLRLEEEGVQVLLTGLDIKEYKGKHGYPAQADLALVDAREQDFDALIIPGGFMPDKLRRVSKVLELTRAFNDREKLICMICHGGWIPISARIVEGRTVTSTPGIKDDLINAGAKWVDEAVVVDGNLISARRPPDLPFFARAIIDYLKEN